MGKVNSLVLCRDYYNSDDEFKDALIDAVILLLNAEYVVVVNYEEKGLGIIRIDYESSDKSLGGKYPFWLSPDEEEFLYNNYEEEEEEECEDSKENENDSNVDNALYCFR